MRLMLWVLFFLVSLSAGTPPNEHGSKGAGVAAIAQIEQEVLRSAVTRHCQETLCLIAVKGKALDDQRLRTLATVGRVAAPSPGDLELDGSGMSGAARSRGAQVIDLLKIAVEGNSATAHVHIYSSVIDGTVCRYRLRRGESGWRVDQKVECTA